LYNMVRGFVHNFIFTSAIHICCNKQRLYERYLWYTCNAERLVELHTCLLHYSPPVDQILISFTQASTRSPSIHNDFSENQCTPNPSKGQGHAQCTCRHIAAFLYIPADQAAAATAIRKQVWSVLSLPQYMHKDNFP
jgi:hypothetical protein